MICSPSKFIVRSHLLYYPDLLHEKAGTLAGKPGARSGDGEVLTRAAAADDVHGRQIRAIEFCDIPTWIMPGKWCLVASMGKGSISLAHSGTMPLRTAANGKPPIPSKRLPIVIMT